MAVQRQLLSFFFVSFVFTVACHCQNSTRQNTTQDALPLPQIDLGYSIIQAVEYATDFYSFNNIRYAEPPIGELRFRAPVPPVGINRTVNDGSQAVICPQASPDWLNLGIRGVDPRTDEDCLFLDVVISKGGFNSREEIGIMPVLVWIYGGGFVAGDKSQSSSTSSGLLIEAMKSTKDPGGVVFVSFNYRLGLFGWLSGSTLEADGTSNAGLLDQRLVLEWVQEHINSFGGDPNNVTLMGESAGGGSVMHQITAYGGTPPTSGTSIRLFHRAVIQSPGFNPIPSIGQEEQLFQTFLRTAEVNSTEEARALDTETLQAVNQRMITPAPYGTFVFNPVVDGTFVPDLPGRLLLEGLFDQDLSLLIGHNSDEGRFFTNPVTVINADFEHKIRLLFPTISAPTLNYVSQVLYPPFFNDTTGRYPYANEYQRSELFIAESIFTCNTNYLARAYENQTYNYVFSVPPGIHGQDVPYTYFVPNGTIQLDGTGRPINATVAMELQDYITSFAVTGNPNLGSQGEEEGPIAEFVVYGEKGRVETVGGDKNGKLGIDPAHNDRCLWWQHAYYYNRSEVAVGLPPVSIPVSIIDLLEGIL